MAATRLTAEQVGRALARYGLTPYRLLDRQYWAVDQPYWDMVLAGQGARQWYEDVQDCDDLAEDFRVDVRRTYWLPVGIVVNDRHAWNVAVLPGLTLLFIDPGWSEGPAYVQPGSPGSLYDLAGAHIWL
jgi:hypothetical protein